MIERSRSFDAPRRTSERSLIAAFLALFLISAGKVQPPLDLIREGNEAFARGNLDEAESLYQMAEERASDPGLVAFNKGTVLYRRNDIRRAELCFRRALGDAAIPRERRASALYNLGNCLVRQAGDSDLRTLQTAIDCYELALRETSDEGIRLDAGHNLEVAKLLWAKAKAKRPNDQDPDWQEPDDPARPPDPAKSEDNEMENKSDGSKKENDVRPELGKGETTGSAPKETAKPVPGQGNLPVRLDKSKMKQFDSPEKAREYLERHAERIRRERHKMREEAAQGDRPRANDW